MKSSAISLPSYADLKLAERLEASSLDIVQAAEALRRRNPKLARSKIMPLIGKLAAMTAA